MKYHFIGDIHGCFYQLIALINNLTIDWDNDKVIFVGDYIDRGPNVKEVLEYIKNIKETYPDSVYLLRGNHEDMAINDSPYWNYNGGGITEEALNHDNNLIKYWKKWLYNNTHFYFKDDNIQACHAGSYYDDVSKNDIDTLIWDRDAFTYGEYNGPLTIVGHTPLNNFPALSNRDKGIATQFKFNIEYDTPRGGLLDIDTGCVYGGNLTGLIINTTKNKIIFHNHIN